MNRLQLHSKLTIALVAMLVISGGLSVLGLRSNYARMVYLRNAVATADKQDGDVESALAALRTHVYRHMNTDLSSGSVGIKQPIQLKYRYERLVAAEQAKVASANTQAAAAAERTCGAQFPASGFNAPRVACVQQYMSANARAAASVPDSLYKFDFVSPRWSPDLAGISIVIFMLSSIALLIRLIVRRFFYSA